MEFQSFKEWICDHPEWQKNATDVKCRIECPCCSGTGIIYQDPARKEYMRQLRRQLYEWGTAE